MQTSLFNAFRSIAYEQAGIDISSEKEPLVAARVGKRIRALGLKDEREYLDVLKGDESGEELVQFLDAISTNFTSFFRESSHFDLFGRQVAQWYAAGQRRFRFWCAASSSGEEPYTIAITLQEAGLAGSDLQLLATDISTRVLNLALCGRYSQKVVKTLPKPLLTRHFHKTGESGPDGELFEVSQGLKDLITFKRLNLSRPPFPMRGPFDFIFCRNVMIYFDTRVRQALVSEMERLLRPDGYLLIGHAETLSGLSTGLSVVEPSVYRKGGRA